jgi:hypothetical protein
MRTMGCILICLALAGLACSNPKAAAEPPGKPFGFTYKGTAHSYREACLTNILPPFTVMIPDAEHAKACDLSGEDDFVLSLEWRPCGDAAESCALPAPGASFSADLGLHLQGSATGKARVQVLRHERPYLVVRVTAESGPIGSYGDIGGELKIMVEDNLGGLLIDKNSWK